MGDEYSIVSVVDRPSDDEPMGSKVKFWFNGSDGHDWLFKFPTKDTGGHWAEKIAYEIAQQLGVHAAVVELAVFRDAAGNAWKGSICRSFKGQYDLHHGNQILVGLDPDYASAKKYRQSQHTVDRIMDSMTIFKNAQFADRCRFRLAGYLVLDALIGNIDRHHENWGVLRKRTNGGWRGRLAPTFDHASSLGRELRDSGTKKSRERFLEELGVEHYANRASGAVFVTDSGGRGPSPLEVVQSCLADHRHRPFFLEACRRVASVARDLISQDVVARVPNEWMTPASRDFTVKFLQHNHRRLAEMVG